MTIADNNSNTATVADSDVFGIYPSPFSDRAFCFECDEGRHGEIINRQRAFIKVHNQVGI